MRWNGGLPTPNIAAAELAVLSLTALVCLSWLQARSNRGWGCRLSIILCAMFACGSLTGIAATGSRAGSLAFVCAAAACAALGGLRWRWFLLSAGGLAALVLALPHAARFAPLAGDGSIDARFTVWRATLAMIADHPWSGIGLSEIPMAFDCWYMPADKRSHFVTALNEPLTMAAAWGVPALALATAALAAVIAAGVRAARAGSRLGALGVALLVVLVVAGQFQSHVFMDWWWGRFLVLGKRPLA